MKSSVITYSSLWLIFNYGDATYIVGVSFKLYQLSSIEKRVPVVQHVLIKYLILLVLSPCYDQNYLFFLDRKVSSHGDFQVCNDGIFDFPKYLAIFFFIPRMY